MRIWECRRLFVIVRKTDKSLVIAKETYRKGIIKLREGNKILKKNEIEEKLGYVDDLRDAEIMLKEIKEKQEFMGAV